MPVSFSLPLLDAFRRTTSLALTTLAGVAGAGPSTSAQAADATITFSGGGTAQPIAMRVQGNERLSPLAAAKLTATQTFSRDRISDDGVDAKELDALQHKLETGYGADVSRTVIRQVIGKHVDTLTLDGVEWVQAKHANYDGQLARLEAVLRDKLANAKLIDANFDGKLEGSDVLWSKDAAGKVDTKKIGQVLADRTRIGAAMVKACEDLAAAGCNFGGNKFSDACWTPIAPSSWTHVVKAGVKPSDALAHMFANGKDYTFECATAIIIVQYKAMLDLLGPKDFDRICGDLKIGAWQNENHLERYRERSGAIVDATAERRASLGVGDYGYYKNWDVSVAGAARGWQGENIIYLGAGRFFGHPFGLTTEDHIIASLNAERNADSTRSATFLDVRMTLRSQLLAEDRAPNE